MATEGGGEGGASPQVIPIASLPLENLVQLKEQVEQEIIKLTTSVNGSRLASNRFKESVAALDTLTPESRGTQALIPLTQSVYVPGVLSNTEAVLVDVGTGYHVRKSVPDAVKYCQRKVDMLKDMMAQTAGPLAEKKRFLQAVNLHIQMQTEQRRAQQREQQQQGE
ncbi:unnamed protein product [Vitrella brassicaformis CCMP3155]|uniref:Prefoldin subunit 5 n=1 Tax=Vitrella brassicaformis (strain CCMP3155) TaxID=1169540 RepID=A0A0G4F808_VITBC|nr:unnamed protein product [Vitrella brassicaformis CCMP3155]|eukprot:CEM08679.1 unnamed protein product [Vitrella brassicaformis CCMP3155]